MASTMVRKQIYLAKEQDRKLKALAAVRGCSEAEVVRDAFDRLPDPAGSVRDRLAAAGLLASLPDTDDVPSVAELAVLEAGVEAWLDSQPEPLGLADAVIADREGR